VRGSAGSGFKCVVAPAPAGIRRPDLCLTVDTAADLACVRRVFGQARASVERVLPLPNLIAAADELSCEEEVA
jgi:hypothetical protein